MPITKIMKGHPTAELAAEGLMYQDPCITDCQRECTSRLGTTIQLEQEAYMKHHPEIPALIELFICNITRREKRKDILKEAGEFFTRPLEQLDKEIRQLLGVPESGPYKKDDKPTFTYEDLDLVNDLKSIFVQHYPPESWSIHTPYASTPNTPSSSFISVISSDTTLPTPEPVPIPEPTISEIFYKMISTNVDKAVYSHFDERAVLYDTAYVELSKCVENVMEIPVVEIKEDICELFYNAYKSFELIILEKERIAAQIAWDRRMRKKLKRTLRRWQNFKGYETPPTPKSEVSSHESYKIPPPEPCVCHPQFHYNRYPKDRFGIYLPDNVKYGEGNMTTTPAISVESIPVDRPEEKTDVKFVRT